MCGSECVLELPLVHRRVVVHMPPCPVSTAAHQTSLDLTLWDHSPTAGEQSFLVQGRLVLFQASTGTTIVQVDVEGHIK